MAVSSVVTPVTIMELMVNSFGMRADSKASRLGSTEVGSCAVAAKEKNMHKAARKRLKKYRCMIKCSVRLEGKLGCKQFGRQINGKFQTVLLNKTPLQPHLNASDNYKKRLKNFRRC